MTFEHPCRNQLNPKTVFWTNVGKIVLIYFFKILPLILDTRLGYFS